MCRCYELQCVNGPVMGNTTANLVHANYSLADAKPSYLNLTVTNKTFTDDQNRTFPGNAGAAEQVVDVLCWNATSDSVRHLHDSC